jgi:hypothetical protein
MSHRPLRTWDEIRAMVIGIQATEPLDGPLRLRATLEGDEVDVDVSADGKTITVFPKAYETTVSVTVGFEKEPAS